VTVTVKVRDRAAEGIFVLNDGLEGRFRAEGTVHAAFREKAPAKKP
jgi:hypothetical protein